MKGTKMQKGITLVALIITIIVLLILAVVAISAVSDSEIIIHSKDAQEEYEKGKEKEKVTLAASEAYLAGQGTITAEKLRNALDSNFGTEKYSIDTSNSEYFKVKITETGREYKVYINGKVEGPFEDNTKLGKATVGIKVEINSTIDGEMYSDENPIIPAGFTAINTRTSYWDAEGGPQKDNGLVIKDESGNEFVWVPVKEDISTTQYVSGANCKEPDVVIGDGEDYDAVASNLTRAECVENPEDNDDVLTSDDFKVELTNMYKSMAESINKYDGFYVGRFETSKNGENPQSKKSSSASGAGKSIEPVCSSGAINWYDLYALNKKYSTSSVQGSMMWGIQYDKMMSWMGDAANITISGYNTNRTCGTAEKDVIKNVYDLYASCKEWTIEAQQSSARSARGGSASWYNIYQNYRYYTLYPDVKAPITNEDFKPSENPTIALGPMGGASYTGSRMALYIK